MFPRRSAMILRTVGLIVTLGLGLLTTPLAADAQQPGKRLRIGYLASGAGLSPRTEAFRQGLRDPGWVEGQNITIEYRWAQGKQERLRDLADELVRLKVDVIVTGGPIATRAAKEGLHLPVHSAGARRAPGGGMSKRIPFAKDQGNDRTPS